MVFADSNILVYASSLRSEDSKKALAAQQLITNNEIAISLQVLQEFYVAARKPHKLNLTHEEAIHFCNLWRQFTVLEPTLAVFDGALQFCNRFKIGYYDAAILAAAQQMGCTTVYSEDFNHNQDYDGIRVVNPFLGI